MTDLEQINSDLQELKINFNVIKALIEDVDDDLQELKSNFKELKDTYFRESDDE